MRDFSFNLFDHIKVSLEQYLDHFERVCEVKGLEAASKAHNEIIRKILLLLLSQKNDLTKIIIM